MKKILVFLIGLALISTVFLSVSAQETLNLICEDDINKYEHVDIAVTDQGGEYVFTFKFRTNMNCQVYCQMPKENDDLLNNVSAFTNHFYLYKNNFLVKDLGEPVIDADRYMKTEYVNVTGEITYTVKMILTIAPDVGTTEGKNYVGAFLILAYKPPVSGESGATMATGPTIDLGTTIMLDTTPPVIDEIYIYSGDKEISLYNAEITEKAPTLRAKYHDDGTGVESVCIKFDAQSCTPSKWDATSLYYNVPYPLEPGNHSFTVNVTDRAGNSNESTTYFKQKVVSDVTAPVIDYVWPDQNEIINVTKPTFAVEYHDNVNGSGINIGSLVFAVDGSSYKVDFDDRTDQGFTYSIATHLYNGPHWWYVYIEDCNEPEPNSAELTINFTVEAPDDVPPSSTIQNIDAEGWHIVFELTAEDNTGGVGVSNVTVYYAVDTCPTSNVASWSYYQIYDWEGWDGKSKTIMVDVRELGVSGGKHTIYLRSIAVDLNGNTEADVKPVNSADAVIVFEPPKEEEGINLLIIAGLFLIGVAGIGAIIVIWFVGKSREARKAMKKAKKEFEETKKIKEETEKGKVKKVKEKKEGGE